MQELMMICGEVTLGAAWGGRGIHNWGQQIDCSTSFDHLNYS